MGTLKYYKKKNEIKGLIFFKLKVKGAHILDFRQIKVGSASPPFL
jgi:hypothetical protein